MLTDEQESELTMLARRAQIVLLAAQGLQNRDIGEQRGIGRVSIARGRERYLELGLQGIDPRSGSSAPAIAC